MPANKMQSSAITGLVAPCKIYNVFETDPAKKVIKECDSRADACDFLGIKSSHVTAIIKNKARHNSKKLGLIVTIR